MSDDGRVNFGWIWTDNLRPLLVEIGLLVGYRFDEPDWIAVEHGLATTDHERDRWFDYPVGRIAVSIALEPGAGVAFFRIDAATDAELERIGWLDALMRNWHLGSASTV